ncbi:EF hand protein (macronuclear) [Tetrahymena thermophila SB210]|uniref:EF hand protein n=1 Tax=Tetrahymena thermophila (strain SB210) TaxID=312017 RepID=Q23KK1_TETTS|nr:EF hand protein [Tetrahymena thermophila SB210]EAR96842.2 EF hand protein [Tetrahymena thermophila SB210]|eukprot:XP_001017087.2 EF hand protein [Tetrahymena thermophila SB210]
MNQESQNSTPSSLKLQEKQNSKNSNIQRVSKSSSGASQDNIDKKESIIAKNASLISNIINSERIKSSDQITSDSQKKIIQVKLNGLSSSSHGSYRKLQSPQKAKESLFQEQFNLTNSHINLKASANNGLDPKFPQILENNVQIMDQSHLKKLQKSGYLFKEDEDQINLSSALQNSNILQHKLSVPSVIQVNKTQSSKKQNSPIFNGKRFSHTLLLSETGQQNTINSSQNLQVQIQSQNSLGSQNDFSRLLNKQQPSQIFTQTQSNLYQLDKLMRYQMKDNFSSPDNTYLKSSQSQRDIMKNINKFTKLDNQNNKNTSIQQIISSRDISYIQEPRQNLSKQTENRIKIKTEQNMNMLISPKSVLSDSKKLIFSSRKSSFNDLKTTNSNFSSKSQVNLNSLGSNFQSTPISNSMKRQNQNFSTQNELSKQGSDIQFHLLPYLPNSFIDEFIQIVKETNISENNSQIIQSNLQSPIRNQKNSSGSQSSTKVLKQIHQEIQNILTNQTIKPIQENIPSSLVDLAKSLKKQLPNLYTGQPSGRAEVQIIKNWLEGTFEQIQNDNVIDVKEKFQKIDDSLILTFNEMVRQVSYQCKERGMLLITVFSCYFSLIKKVSQYEQEEKRKATIQNYYEKLILQKNSDDDLDSKNNQIKALQELLQLEKDKNAQLKEDIKQQEIRERENIFKNDKLKKLNDFAKVQLIKMKREIDDLRTRLQSKELFQQKKLEKVLLDYKSNIKRQASTSYYSVRSQEKLEESDQQLIQSLLQIPQQKKLASKTTIDDINDKIDLSFTELIKEAENDANNLQNDVIIKQVFEEKTNALVCQECQTDPMMTLTYTKSIKVQTDLDLMDKKYDKVFASKQKVDDFVREQQIKADLLALEEEYENDNSLMDQESGPPSSRNPDKPILSNLFQGLPIKKLKKKIPKNQLERFIENMGVLYSYVREPDTNIEKDRTENLKNMIQQNIKKEELHGLISMKEIKEEDEQQEREPKKRKDKSKKTTIVKPEVQQNDFPKTASQTNIPSSVAPPSQVQQGRTNEFQRNNQRSMTLNQMKKQQKLIEASSLAEKNLLRDQIKQQFEINFYQNLTNQQLIDQIKKQQQLIEQMTPYAFGEPSLDQSFNKKANTSSSSPQSKTNIGKKTSIQGSFQDQTQINFSPNQKQSFMTPINSSPQVNKSPFLVSENNSQLANQSAVNKIQLMSTSNLKGVQFKAINLIEESEEYLGKSNTENRQNTSLSIHRFDEREETNNSLIFQDQNIIPADLKSLNGNDSEIKKQVMSLIHLYNMEIEKNCNLRESLEELIKLLREMYQFLKMLFIHIKKTQKHTHKSIIEGFIQQFTSIKWKLPKDFDTNFEKEVLKEDKEDEKKKLLRLKFSNKKSTIKFLAHVQRTQAFNKMTQVDKNTHFGFILVNKIREQGIPKKFTTFLPLKNTLKYIQNLVDERVRMIREQRLPKDQEMPIFSFNKFLQIFGFKKVAENKYTQFLMSVIQYQSIFRVNMFTRLLTVNSDKKMNYSIDEMEKYFQAYEFIVNLSTMGVLNPSHSETDSTFMVPHLKALDYIKVILEKIMPFEDLVDLRQQLDNMKEVDLKHTNKIHVVDFDIFMSKVLQKYRILMNKTQLFVKNAFFAADLDGNGRINLNEFLTLYRHIMSNRFNLMRCIKMFEEKADIITEEEKNLSFEKFTAICIDYNLFTTQIQDKYINVQNKEDILQKMQQLQESWNDEQQKIKEKIEVLKPFVVPESYKNWVEVLKVLEHRILDEEIQEENLRPILIAHKLLNDELQRLIEEGKKGAENEEDDDDDDEDLFTYQDEDDNDLQMILKSMNSKPNQSQMNTTIQEFQNKTQLDADMSRNETQLSTQRLSTQNK